MENINKHEIHGLVFNYKTKHPWGFIASEQKDLLSKFPDINMEKYEDALMGITCMKDDEDGFIIYPIDIYYALVCGVENRNLKVSEFD